MKYINYLLGAMVLFTTSCVDDEPLAFDVEKPASIASMEYTIAFNVSTGTRKCLNLLD